jgi:hypothetical protein
VTSKTYAGRSKRSTSSLPNTDGREVCARMDGAQIAQCCCTLPATGWLSPLHGRTTDLARGLAAWLTCGGLRAVRMA